MDFNFRLPAKNQRLISSKLNENECQLFIKREDQIHPIVSGNKFRKLKYNLQEANYQQKRTLLTFGGAYSNHILATALAGKLQKFQTVGIIRGEELGDDISKTLTENPTLRNAFNYGMKLEFVSREHYRKKTSATFLEGLKKKYGNCYFIPEGGTNPLAIKGCEEILTKGDDQFDYICLCVGTGGTLQGIINSAQSHQKILGFSVLKGDFLENEIRRCVRNQFNWELITDYHFGGYAKYSDELIHCINQFKKTTQIQLDPIYTGKMVYGILDMFKKSCFPKGSKILMIHTGGLQGIEGFNHRLKSKNKGIQLI